MHPGTQIVVTGNIKYRNFHWWVDDTKDLFAVGLPGKLLKSIRNEV